ncbi:restriction endonuclease subunit S, partial [Acinetobacter baumannii]
MSIRSGQPGINSQEYASYRFLIPQKEEQDKIAKFLSLLDSRIEAQIKIIDKLQSLIKELIDALLENPSWEKAYLSSFMHFF